MNSTNFNKFIEDFSSISSADSSSFERILRKFPYFQTAALFLAKSNPISHNTQTAALRSADRRVLRSWLDEEYRKELEREKQDIEAKQLALETQKDKNEESFNENLDINTESINAFDKLVGTSNTPKQDVQEKEIILEENKDVKLEKINPEIDSIEETSLQQNEIIENEYKPTNSFFDEIEDEKVVIKKETTETKIDSSNFFDEIDEVKEKPNQPNELIFKEQSDINEPLLNQPSLEISKKIPAESTDANFFDEIEDMKEYPNEPIFKEQSDINEPLLNQPSLEISKEIPAESTDANFFDGINDMEEYPDEPIFREQSDINQPLPTSSISEIFNEVPAETMDANFFDEIEGDDAIFGDAQKDLDNYDFPDFKDEKKEIDKNKKVNENKKEDEDEGSFFDGI